jgi:NTE family protein
MKISKWLVIIVFIIFSSKFVFGQKVGLVLSGGGSKGLAHIGVIRALEENGIPINYVAGTSMGAIIGGLYAAGYSPDEMEKIFLSEEFKYWISGKIDPKYFYYFKKEIPNASWIDLRFNYKTNIKPKLPTNLVSPHQMDFAFMEIFSGTNSISGMSFDSLFVPFRCMAADIYHNKPVVLKSGDLGRAIRASMTFPFYFKPIEIDSILLFDGGMYNNFPTDVMYEEFFPDIIIGSKVATNYPKPDPDDIVSMLQNMLMEKNDYSVICDNGILLTPNVKKVNVIDFSYIREFIDSGYAETIRNIDRIKFFVQDTVSPELIKTKRVEFNNRKKPLEIGEIKIEGLNEGQKKYVNKLLLNKNKNELKDIKKEYFKLLTDDKIETITPKLIYDDTTQKYNLLLDIKKDKNFVADFGGNVSSSPINEAFVQLQYKYLNQIALSAILNTYIGKFYSSGLAKLRFDFPYKTPFYAEGSFVIHQWDFFKTKTYFFEDKTPSYLIQNEKFYNISVGLPISNNAKIVFKYSDAKTSNEYYQNNVFTRQDTSDLTEFNSRIFGVLLDHNTLNKKQYANSGSRFMLKVNYINGNEMFKPGSTTLVKNYYEKKHKWVEASLFYQKYFLKNSFYTPGILLEAFYSNQKFFSNYTASILSYPQFTPVPESKTLFYPIFRSNKYGAFGLINVFKLFKNIDLRFEGYVFKPYHELALSSNNEQVFTKNNFNPHYVASSSMVFHSPIGPISFSLNYYHGTEQPLSLIFNMGYIIFNPKSKD